MNLNNVSAPVVESTLTIWRAPLYDEVTLCVINPKDRQMHLKVTLDKASRLYLAKQLGRAK